MVSFSATVNPGPPQQLSGAALKPGSIIQNLSSSDVVYVGGSAAVAQVSGTPLTALSSVTWSSDSPLWAWASGTNAVPVFVSSDAADRVQGVSPTFTTDVWATSGVTVPGGTVTLTHQTVNAVLAGKTGIPVSLSFTTNIVTRIGRVSLLPWAAGLDDPKELKLFCVPSIGVALCAPLPETGVNPGGSYVTYNFTGTLNAMIASPVYTVVASSGNGSSYPISNIYCQLGPV